MHPLVVSVAAETMANPLPGEDMIFTPSNRQFVGDTKITAALSAPKVASFWTARLASTWRLRTI